MKIKSIVFALVFMFSFGTGYADNQADSAAPATNQSVTVTETSQAKLILAGSCPTGCASCWDQCTTSSDCGSGHKCISTTCGNRCTKK